MPVNLDAIPPPAPAAQRPVTRRWMVFLAVMLTAGNALTFCLWSDERSGYGFWLIADGLPFALWALFFCLRRVGYRCDQIGAAAWNRARERLIAQETRRGQRHAWLLHRGVFTQAGNGVEKLIDAFRAKTPLLAVQPPIAGGKPVRHSRLKGVSCEQQITNLDNAVTNLAIEMKTALDTIPDTIPLWLAVDCDSKITPDAMQRIGGIVAQHTGRIYHSAKGRGLEAFDRWLDYTWETPAVLVAISVQLHGDILPDTGEAITLVVLSNRRHPHVADSVHVHRPEIGPNGVLATTLSRALLWANCQPEKLCGAWTTGPITAQDGDWIGACENNGLALNMTTANQDIDRIIGYTGRAAPWLAVIIAATPAAEQGSQVIAAQTGADEVGVAVVTPGEPIQQYKDIQ